MQLFKKILLRLLIVLCVCFVAGLLQYGCNKILPTLIPDKPYNWYLYSYSVWYCILLAGAPIIIIYWGWRLTLFLINYASHQRLILPTRLFFKLTLTILSCFITMMIFGGMAGGINYSAYVFKNLIIILFSSISITILEYNFKL